MRRYIIFGVFALSAMVAGFTLRLQKDNAPSANPTLVPVAHRVAEGPVSHGSLILNVRREGDNLKLLWDPQAIPHATSAELYITDGNHQSKLSLNQSLFASGKFSYLPITRDVTFRLEIAGGPSIAGSVKPWGDTPQAETAVKPEKKSVLAAFVPRKAPAKGRTVAVAEVKASEVGAPPVESRPASSLSTLEVPQSLPVTPVVPPVVPPAPARPAVSIASEPLPPSRFGRAVNRVGRLPLIRRLRKSGEPVVPPRPVHQVMPVLSAADRSTLVLPLAVAIRVAVNESGRVESAEPTAGTARHTAFANAAISAALRWRFSPARVGDEPVPGKVVLHFKFQPEK